MTFFSIFSGAAIDETEKTTRTQIESRFIFVISATFCKDTIHRPGVPDFTGPSISDFREVVELKRAWRDSQAYPALTRWAAFFPRSAAEQAEVRSRNFRA
jgi:hypothetical protein